MSFNQASSGSHLHLNEPAASPTVRDREVAAGRLVLRASSAGDAFLVRRAAGEVDGLPPGPARRGLERAVEGIAASDAGAVRSGLLVYGAVLERHGLHPAASQVYRCAMDVSEPDACVTLHAGRAARKSGDREEALRLYGLASTQAAGDPTIGLLVRIGEALVSEDPLAALSPVVRAARREGEREALAIAREERARVNRSAGRAGAAIRDLMAAAGRYADRTDRIRVVHALADVLIARGDLAGAREALLAALDCASGPSRGHTVQRLRTVARSMGDQVELHRTRGQETRALVGLSPLRSTARPRRTLTSRLRRWRSLLPAL